MAKVVDGVVDGRCGKEENLLGTASFLVEVLLQFAVAGGFLAAGAGNSGIAKVMGFVDQENVGVFDGALDAVGPFSPTLQVGVAVADERLEVAGKIGQKFFSNGFQTSSLAVLGAKRMTCLP